jgi:hypothetical protein
LSYSSFFVLSATIKPPLLKFSHGFFFAPASISVTLKQLSMSSGSSGRPKGTQNRPGHYAGGSRIGAGRKRKVRIDSSSPEPEVAEPAGASSSTTPAEAGPGEPSQSLLSDVIDNLSWDFRP